MARVVVTGCSGKLGRAVIRELLSHGRTGANLDRAPPPVPVPEDIRRFARIDFTGCGQARRNSQRRVGVVTETLLGIPFETPTAAPAGKSDGSTPPSAETGLTEGTQCQHWV